MVLPHTRYSGFTLIELAIVLVIIGLIIGAVLVGQDMIKSAEIQRVIKDIDQIQTASMTFRVKYNCVPGDCENVSAYFGAWSTGGTPDTVSGALNGNGDGILSGSYERLGFYRHLSLATLLPGQYAGPYDYPNPTPTIAVDVNVPRSRIGSGMYFVNSANGFSIYGRTGKNYIQLQGTVNPWSIFSPKEARRIDEKMDDGVPSSGRVFSISEAPIGTRQCTTDDNWLNNPTSAQYLTNVDSPECWMLIWF